MSYEKAIQSPIEQGGLGRSAMDQREIDAVAGLLRDPDRMWRYHEESHSRLFSKEVREIVGSKFALMVNSGTSALVCCLAGLGVGIGDEVIVQGYTYIATASACIDVGAIPIVAEIDDSLSLDPDDVERKITPRTKAVIMAHMQGVPGRLEEVRDVAKKHGLFFIEDCCQAIGAKYRGDHVGATSDAFCWSLNFWKTITCGEGGVFFTNQDDVFLRGFYLSDPAAKLWQNNYGEGMTPIPDFSRGCFRLSEICAAVARVQLQKLDGMLEKTRALKKVLLGELDSPVHYALQHVSDADGDCGISAALILNNVADYEKFAEALLREGLDVGGAAYRDAFPDRHVYRYWDALYHEGKESNTLNYPWNNPAYKGDPGYYREMCPRTLDILSRSIRLSIHPTLTEQNMKEFALAINRADKSF